MAICFICDSMLFGKGTEVCSSVTPHSKVPYPEKIVELLGEEFLIKYVPDANYMCTKCTSLVAHMDKLLCARKMIEDTMRSNLQKRFGLLPPKVKENAPIIKMGPYKPDFIEEMLYKCSFCNFQSEMLSHVRYMLI